MSNLKDKQNHSGALVLKKEIVFLDIRHNIFIATKTNIWKRNKKYNLVRRLIYEGKLVIGVQTLFPNADPLDIYSTMTFWIKDLVIVTKII